MQITFFYETLDLKLLIKISNLVRLKVLSIVAPSMGKFVCPSFFWVSVFLHFYFQNPNLFPEFTELFREGETWPGQWGSPLGTHNMENLVKAAAEKAEKRWHPKTDQRTHAWTNRIILKQSSQWKLKRATTTKISTNRFLDPPSLFFPSFEKKRIISSFWFLQTQKHKKFEDQILNSDSASIYLSL